MAEVTFVGALATVEEGQYGPVLHIDLQGGGSRTVYLGNQYQGEVPVAGDYGEWVVWEQPPKAGRKYGSKYLNAFTPGERPNGNGSAAAAPRGRGRDPQESALIIAQNLFNRATDLCCAGIIKVDDIQGTAKDMVDELFSVAGVVHDRLEGIGRDGWRADAAPAEPPL